ncbi:unnamed protein product [Linum trigynum]|uniref:Reverse transcriptase/retrotransposon-derived protein RNase H-like domain-containing protein n=1 Tax=Linum trigynum TaxID=586398 RepID=A0AAV2DXZ9_9ROSI
MITTRGIEVNPKQMDAICQLKSPHNAQEVQSLAGKMAALGRFIPRSVDRCVPFFHILNAGTKFKWDDACEKAFVELKMYLVSTPVLVAPEANEMLYVYLAVSARAVSEILISRAKGSDERVV